MRLAVVALCLSLFSFCGQQTSFEERAKNYMKDSVVVSFNDPKSYEFVSMTVDTFRGKDNLGNIRSIYTPDYFDSTEAKKQLHTADSLALIKDYSDRIILIEPRIKFRAKNKLNALILSEQLLYFDPATNSFDYKR